MLRFLRGLSVLRFFEAECLWETRPVSQFLCPVLLPTCLKEPGLRPQLQLL